MTQPTSQIPNGLSREKLVRQPICFSKSAQRHDLVIGLFVNRYAVGRAV